MILAFWSLSVCDEVVATVKMNLISYLLFLLYYISVQSVVYSEQGVTGVQKTTVVVMYWLLLLLLTDCDVADCVTVFSVRVSIMFYRSNIANYKDNTKLWLIIIVKDIIQFVLNVVYCVVDIMINEWIVHLLILFYFGSLLYPF